jgi:hypothetical protein
LEWVYPLATPEEGQACASVDQEAIRGFVSVARPAFEAYASEVLEVSALAAWASVAWDLAASALAASALAPPDRTDQAD